MGGEKWVKIFKSNFLTLFDLELVARGSLLASTDVALLVRSRRCSVVGAGGSPSALVLEMLASAHKSDFGGFFLPGRATVSTLLAVSGEVLWRHVKLDVSSLARGEFWCSGTGQVVSFSVSLVTNFLGFSRWWPFVGFLQLWVT